MKQKNENRDKIKKGGGYTLPLIIKKEFFL